MDRIEIAAPNGQRRSRYFARSTGTKFTAVANDDKSTTIDLFDEIGYFGTTARDFNNRVKDISGDIVLRINSPGGDVFDGVAIFNMLKAHKGNVRVEIVGIAASIASIIAMAGDERHMADNAMMMVHNSWTLAVGNKSDLSDTAELLGKIDDSMARTYATATGLGVRSIKQMMDDETWLTGKEAKEHGFATDILKPSELVTASAKFDLSVYENVPKSLQWPEDTFNDPETDEDFVKVLMRGAENRTRTQAKALIKAIKAGKTSLNDTMPGAGDVKLEGLLEALKAFRS